MRNLLRNWLNYQADKEATLLSVKTINDAIVKHINKTAIDTYKPFLIQKKRSIGDKRHYLGDEMITFDFIIDNTIDNFKLKIK